MKTVHRVHCSAVYRQATLRRLFEKLYHDVMHNMKKIRIFVCFVFCDVCYVLCVVLCQRANASAVLRRVTVASTFVDH